MCRTVVNITGDATVSTIVSKFQKNQNWVSEFLNLGKKF
jgi:Na+/H+-dicarboxylate symporter